MSATSFGQAMIENWTTGFLTGLGHVIEDGRCSRCGDSREAIIERVAGSTTEQLLLGELRCSGS